MIELETPITTKQYLGEPNISIFGSSANGTRTMIIDIPVTDENGYQIKTITKEYRKEEFNQVYQTYYDTDKNLLSKVLTDTGINADISTLSNDLLNEGSN